METRCGRLKELEGPGGVIFEGPVTLGNRLDGTLKLLPHPRANLSVKTPHYEVLYRTPGFSERPIGAAWKHDRKARGASGYFLTMTLIDPDWPDALNLTAWPPEGNETDWALVYSRAGAREAVRPPPRAQQ